MSFVVLTKKEFEDILPPDCEEVNIPGCNEYVYDIGTDNADVNVRVYSTIDKSTDKTRKIGADAIRIVFWGNNGNHPIGKGKKILRVEGKTTIRERIQGRIEEFLNGAFEQEDNTMPKDYLIAVLSHDSIAGNNFAQSLLDGLDKYGSLTDNQLAYVIGENNPKGWLTFEAKVKSKDPNFYQNYLDNKKGADNGHNDTISEDPKPESKPIKAGKTASKLRKKVQELKKSNEKQSGNDQIFITSDGTDVKLVPTKDYPDFQYPFESFNPVQSLALPYKEVDCNMVISANTSAGKTITVEPMIDATLKQGRKVLYLAPLKALVSEKYEDWQIRFPDKQIVILTGDYSLSENKKAALNTADIIVLTSEMLDSRTRKMETENNIFLKMAGLILVDESHILTMQDRGHAMEVALMRFTSINSYARVILLSATMPNVGELGEWLTVLNSKKSVVLYCNWRPVTLQMHYREHHVFVNSRGYPDYWATQNGKRKMAVEIAMDKLSESFLIFVHDKATGRDLISRFKKEKEVAVFHSADLEKDARKKLEDAFRSRKQRVMISTSTTAFGLNLPARNVIIVGVSRGINPVDELEIIQEAGRAGRYGIDDEGHVFLIVPEGTTFEWEHKIANPRPVNSVLNDHDVLAFHALAEITNKVIRDKRSFMEWFNRSLAAKQEILPFREENAQGLLEDLNTMEMIEYQGVSPYVTGLGKVSSWLYFSPYDVYSWYKNFNQIYASGERMDDELLAWAIADIPSNNPGYVIKAMQGVASEWQYRFRSRGFACSDAILSVIAMYEKLTDKDNVGGIVNVLKRNIIFDIERTIQALSLIDGLHAKWNQEGLWQSLPTRVKYSVPMEMVELVSIPGVGGVRAHQLWEQDLCSVEDVARAESKKLYAAVGKVVGLKIKKAAADVFAKKG